MEHTIPLNVALLGAGTFATTTHRSILLPLISAKRITIAFIWSRRPDPARALSALYPNKPPVYYQLESHPSALASIADALNDPDCSCDAVIMALPPGPQEEIASFAHSIGKHVLLEKPLAIDLSAARKLLQSAALLSNPRIHLALAENYRFEPAMRLAAELVSLRCKGVVAARLTVKSPMPEGSRYGRGWRLEMDGPGILLDGCVHHFAGLRLVLGADIRRVAAKCSRMAGWFKGSDTVTAHLTMTNGVSVSLLVTYASKTPLWELEVIGKDADVLLQRDLNKAGYSVSVMCSGGENSKKITIEEDHISFGGLEAEFDAFFRSCVTGKLNHHLDAKQGFNDMATVFALYNSSTEGKEITVESIAD